MKVLLDTGILGLVTHPKAEHGTPCVNWLKSLIEADISVVIPEICDYELRRKYLHLDNSGGLKRLDALIGVLEFRPVDTSVWKAAAAVWAECRKRGKATAHPEALDGDVILIATAQGFDEEEIVIATTNVKHLQDFVDARVWESIPGT